MASFLQDWLESECEKARRRRWYQRTSFQVLLWIATIFASGATLGTLIFWSIVR